MSLRNQPHPIAVDIPTPILLDAIEFAKAASIGGQSQVRDRSSRSEKLFEDQLVGQLVHAAASQYLFASYEPWRRQRERANANPFVGDGGADFDEFDGLRLDIKGSLMRGNPDPMKYNLVVRPKELHTDTTYLLGLAQNTARVLLVGVITGKRIELAFPVCQGGLFAGAHVVPAERLFGCEHLWRHKKQPV